MRGRLTQPSESPVRNLSTGGEPVHPQAVDDRHRPEASSGDVHQQAGANSPTVTTGCWLGCVVPKRQARRAVTRSLIKRQIRSAAQRHEKGLAAGIWLVRLKQGFPVADFPSACSDSLRKAVRDELDRLFDSTIVGSPRSLRKGHVRTPVVGGDASPPARSASSHATASDWSAAS